MDNYLREAADLIDKYRTHAYNLRYIAMFQKDFYLALGAVENLISENAKQAKTIRRDRQIRNSYQHKIQKYNRDRIRLSKENAALLTENAKLRNELDDAIADLKGTCAFCKHKSHISKMAFEESEEPCLSCHEDKWEWRGVPDTDVGKMGAMHDDEKFSGPAIDKLSEYESMEEKHRIVKLPFAIGEKAIYRDEDGSENEVSVEGYSIDALGELHINIVCTNHALCTYEDDPCVREAEMCSGVFHEREVEKRLFREEK